MYGLPGVYLIGLARDTDQIWAFVTTEMNLLGSRNGKNGCRNLSSFRVHRLQKYSDETYET
jgi:hypothetical protein